MNRSTERFLTTHTGSLPRPEDLVRTMFAKEEGVPVDLAALNARIRSAVAAVVAKQVELRHLHQGPARRLWRREPPARLPRPGRFPGVRPAGLWRPRPLAAQDT